MLANLIESVEEERHHEQGLFLVTDLLQEKGVLLLGLFATHQHPSRAVDRAAVVRGTTKGRLTVSAMDGLEHLFKSRSHVLQKENHLRLLQANVQ